MLKLDDPRWEDLRGAFDDDVREALRAVLRDGNDKGSWDDLSYSVYHQGSTYAASFAALPYLVCAATSLAPDSLQRAVMLSIAASIAAAHLLMKGGATAKEADYRAPKGTQLPPEVLSGVESAIVELRRAVYETLCTGTWDKVYRKYMLAALATTFDLPRVAYVIETFASEGEICPDCGADLGP